ncbi:MAG: hypothetical protein JO343_10825 [Candidatus Eremiobacteraeota bacterium]|nr:hypothetical protein [Candidatus Eremiobacteraeota bacterium]
MGPGVADGQQLRRLSISRGIGMDSSFGVQLRDVSGTGGFAAPGLNLAAIVPIRFSNLNELYLTYGSPASTATLDRFLLKYVFNIGSGSGV